MNNTRIGSIDLLKEALSPLRSYLDDPLVNEVMINSENDVWVEKSGVIDKVDVTISSTSLSSVVLILASMEQKDAFAGTDSGILDARMNGFRVAAILSPTSIKGTCISIRKHSVENYSLQDLQSKGAFGAEQSEILKNLVLNRKNVLVVGGTSSGKTTLLNAMIQEIPHQDRVITIEDTQELKVGVPNYVQLESNYQKNVTPRMLVKASLRFRPDRILLGEVRGGEAYDLLNAANTGHDGVLATLHSNSALKGLSRFENLVLQSGIDWPHQSICKEIADVFDYVVFVDRVQGKRRLSEILELHSYDMETRNYSFTYQFKRTDNEHISAIN